MKRTITMNLSGIIFHIEEDAYEVLHKYLATIRGYFNNSDGRDEIMKDIELRIAEMLQEKVSATKQAVIMADVESIIAVMGKPEDFAGDEEKNNHEKNNSRTNMESENYYSTKKRRRVFRDTDDKVLGGVCSGIANYFDFDPIWLRAAFALSFFAFGSGLLLYIVLWIIIPAAKTTAEKLEMRGEKVNINNIGKAVNEEFEDFKKRMKDFGEEVKSPENKEKVKNAANGAAEFLKDIFHNIFIVLGKIVAVVLVFIGIALAIGIIATLFGRGTISVFGSQFNSIHFSLYEFCAAVLPASIPLQLVVIGLILFIGIPVLAIIFGGIKFLFGIKEKNRLVKYSANILWLCGLGILVYTGIETGYDFSEDASIKQKLEIAQPTVNTLYLDAKYNSDDDLERTYSSHHRIHFGDWSIISKDENNFRIEYPTVNIVKSETDSFEVVATKSASGFDKKEAALRAKRIDYSVQSSDSILYFNPFFDVKTSDKLRAQEIKITVKVPLNKTIYLNRRMDKIIFNIDNVSNTYDGDMVNHKWTMTSKGLECVDCKGL